MATLPILQFPDARLRKVATPVAAVNAKVKNIVSDMFETMYDAPGIGLAATQVNIHQRIIVIDISDDQNEPLVLINPEFTVLDKELFSYKEGCLSIPGFYEEVERPKKIHVQALNQEGEAFSFDAEGLLAVCVQHEIDHINGKLFVDYISKLKRDRIRKKMEKLQ